MTWALDLVDELHTLVDRWQQEFTDYPAHKMISDLRVSGLCVSSSASPGQIASVIAGYAEGRPGAVRNMLDRIERAREPDGEGDDLTLEDLLVDYLSVSEWD